MMLNQVRVAWVAALAIAGCVDDEIDPTVDEDTDEQALAKGDPDALVVGFNGGPDQFPYFDRFFAASTASPAARLCHTYVLWNLADQPPGGDPTVNGSRAFL